VKQWRFAGFDDSFSGFVAVGNDRERSSRFVTKGNNREQSSRLKSEKASLVGCITAGTYVEGFVYGTIEVDGFDVTEKIVSMLNSSRFREQIKCIFLSGITFAGFNVADIAEINERTYIPVIAVMKRVPDFERILRALDNVPSPEIRRKAMERAGEITRLEHLYVQLAGCSREEAREYIRASRLKGNTPECLRIAHLVASAIAHGESRKTL